MLPPAERRSAPPGPRLERGDALPALPLHQGMWVGTAVVVAAVLALTGLWALYPNLALAIAIGAGAGAVDPRKLWAIPAGAAAALAAGMIAGSFGFSTILGAGAAAGALATWLLPYRTDRLDLLHGALGVLAGSAMGLWIATGLLPSLPVVISSLVITGITGFMGAMGLLPTALRYDAGPPLPTTSQIKATLKLRFRPSVLRALELHDAALRYDPPAAIRRGLTEVANWVYRLQLTRQTLREEADAIDPVAIQAKIAAYQQPSSDPFTEDRRRATARHLARLLEHRKAIEVEIGRNEALVDYALAFLEEARAGLVVARELPGDTIPERLDEVLSRLRSHAAEGDARRRSARALQRAELEAVGGGS